MFFFYSFYTERNLKMKQMKELWLEDFFVQQFLKSESKLKIHVSRTMNQDKSTRNIDIHRIDFKFRQKLMHRTISSGL